MATDMGRSRFAPVNGNGVQEASPNGDTNTNGTAEAARAAEAMPNLKDNSDASPAFRDKLGRYRVDNPGGPGNPFGRHVMRNRRIMLAALTDEEVHGLVRKLYDMATAPEGNLGAMKLLLQYVIGKPVPTTNPDRAYHEEWELRMQQPSREERNKQNEQLPHHVVLLSHRAMDLSKCTQLRDLVLAGVAEDKAAEQKQRERAERRAKRKAERQRRRRS